MKELVSKNGDTVQIDQVIEYLEQKPNGAELLEGLKDLRQDKVKGALAETVKAAQFSRVQALEAFLYEKGLKSKSQYTVNTYRRELERMFAWLDRQAINLLQMSRQDVIRFKGYLTERYSVNSVRLALSVNSAFWTWLEAEAYVDSRPWVQIPYPKREYRKSVKQGKPGDPVMSEEEYQAILSELHSKMSHEGIRIYDERIRRSARKLKAACHVMGEYGLRLGSLQTVKRDGEYFTYRVKGGAIQKKALRPITEMVIEEAGLNREEPFKRIGRAGIQIAVSRLTVEMAGRGVIRHAYSCHDFRHYYAVKLYRETRDIYMVKEALGHASVTVTETYLAGMGALEKRGV